MELAKNVTLNILKTNKYKDVNIYFCFSRKVDFYEYTKSGLIALLLGETSEHYRTKEEMARLKDNLYAASMQTRTRVISDGMLFSIRYDFLNPKFTQDVTLNDYFSFIEETLFHSLMNENNLEEIKRISIDSVRRSLDKPQVLAREEVNKYITSKLERFKINLSDAVYEMQKVKLEEVIDEYQKILNESRLDIYVVGDVDEEEYQTFIQKLNFKDRQNFEPTIFERDILDFEDQIMDKQISQSYLNIVYQTPFHSLHKDFYGWVVGNSLLGNSANSFLFEEVREKRGLCYSIGLIDYKTEGFVRIQTAINHENAEEVKDIVFKQIKRLQEMDYPIERLELTKLIIKNALLSSNDDVDQYVMYIATNRLFDIHISLEEYAEGLCKVTQEDIARVFKQYRYGFSHLLKGVQEDEDL